MEFLSPITPDDLVRQSLPYSYLTISARSNDGAPHDVQIYTDVDVKFLSNDWTMQAKWNTTQAGGLVYHQAYLRDQVTYGEFDDFTLAGSVVYATAMEDGVTYATGYGRDLRKNFHKARKLPNTHDSEHRAIKDRKPVLAFSKDLGKIDPKQDSMPFTLVIGHYRSPAISWTATPSQHPDRDLFYMSKYPSLQESLLFFYEDFAESVKLSSVYDEELHSKALEISPKYKALVTLAARQVFAGMEISIGKYEDGQYDTGDVMSFMKEIATSNYINTVDIIYPAFPFFIYSGPAILKSLMEPVLRYTASGRYPNKWCLHDLGYKYPNATGHDDGLDEAMFIEETAGMLIMQAAYVEVTGDASQLENYYSIFDGWAQYLLGEALYPQEQVASDDFQGPLTNSTNLAVKGIVGIGAMAKMAAKLGKMEEAKVYQNKAAQYAGEFLKLALANSGSHVKLTYSSEDDSWVMLYHLFGDKLLGLGLFPQWLYNVQSAHYNRKMHRRGLALDSRNSMAKSDWQIMNAAAYSENPQARAPFIDGVFEYLEDGSSLKPLPDAYHIDDDEILGFVDRPVVGSLFSILAVEKLQAKRRGL